MFKVNKILFLKLKNAGCFSWNADWQFDKDDSDKKVLHVVSFGVTRFRFDRYLMTTHTFLSFIVCKEGHQIDYVVY